MTIVELAPRPSDETVSAAGRVLPRLRDYLAGHDEDVVRLEPAGETCELEVPRDAVEVLAQVLAHLADGQAVSIVATDDELTTQQAADLANVSRPYLIKLLDEGKIAYRKVGKHRRILTAAMLAYLAKDNAMRLAAADELTRLSAELGI